MPPYFDEYLLQYVAGKMAVAYYSEYDSVEGVGVIIV